MIYYMMHMYGGIPLPHTHYKLKMNNETFDCLKDFFQINITKKCQCCMKLNSKRIYMYAINVATSGSEDRFLKFV